MREAVDNRSATEVVSPATPREIRTGGPARGLIEAATPRHRIASPLLSGWALAAWDGVAVCVALFILLQWIAPPAQRGEFARWAGLMAVGVFYVLWRRRAWAERFNLSAIDDAPVLFLACVVSSPLAFFLAGLVGTNLGPSLFLYLAGVTFGCLLTERVLVRAWQRSLRRRGIGLRQTLIIGAGKIGMLLGQRLLTHPELGLQPVGYLDKEPLVDAAAEDGGLPVLGSSYDLGKIIDSHQIDMVVVAFSTAPHEVLLRIVRTCQERSVGLAVVPRLFETITTGVGFDQLSGIPVIGLRHTRLTGVGWWVKRTVDVLGSLVLLVGLSPVLAGCALAVKLDSPGPVLYRQERVGRDRRTFQMVKFRTLEAGAEHKTGAMWSTVLASHHGQSYVTRVGRILRKTSLDELPQLWNVLKGEMSLIGPRPERPVFVNQFIHEIYRYGDRMRVKAGMTGWAQVHGLKGDGGSLLERIEYDNYYIENWSLWLDVKVALLTVCRIWNDIFHRDSSLGTHRT